MKKILFKILTLIVFSSIIISGIIIPNKMFENFINAKDEERRYSETEGNIIRPNGDKLYEIYLETDKHCSVVNENPQKVAYGKNAEFEVVFEDNYTFKGTNGNSIYNNGKIIIENCTKKTTITQTSKTKSAYYNFEYQNAPADKGEIKCNVKKGRLIENQEITLTVTAKNNNNFLGWTTGDTLLNGGTVISYSSNYTFNLNGDLKLYPNFLEKGYSIVKYNLNGGVLADDGQTETIYKQFNKNIKYCTNLDADLGQFVKKNCTILEYNTKQDGSGMGINPGGIVKIPDSDFLEVWIQWSQWNPEGEFRYDIKNNEVTITNFVGNSSTVSIPETIKGYPVTSIAMGAFIGCNFDTFVLPRSLVKIDSSAIQRCKNFKTLYICDTITNVPDNFYTDCGEIENIRLNAARKPHYPTGSESIATRYENIVRRDPEDAKKPIILLVGGSSSLYGYNSPHLEKLLGDKYYVINCGTNADGNGMAYIEMLTTFMKPGDIIVDAPEFGANQFAKCKFTWRTFRATECCYNLFRYIKFSRYKYFFSALSAFNTDKGARSPGGGKDYDVTNYGLTPYNCDLPKERFNLNGKFGKISVSPSHLNNEVITKFNEIANLVNDRGMKMYLSSAPVCLGGEQVSKGHKEGCNSYFAYAKEKLQFPVISNPADYMFKLSQYNNSGYHLTSAGATLRTEQLAKDLLRQFEKEK